MPSVLEKDFEYYLAHQDELVRKFVGKYLLIREEKVLAAFDSQMEALNAGAAKFALGTFLIQKCEPGSDSYTQTFRSRVYIPKE